MAGERKQEERSLTFSIPTGSPLQLVLVAVLVIGAFFFGTLTEKVKLLEKGYVASAGTNPSGTGGGGVVDPNAPPAVPTVGDVPEVSDEDHVRGNENAKIALIEYSDLECPFCKQFHPTAQQIVDTYKDDVKWVYRHYPLSFHANAQKEAEASECANELGGGDAFWKYIDAIYERTTANGTGFALDALVPLAKELGLDEAKFKSCLDSGKYAQKIQDQMAAGTAAGITGTPGNILLHTGNGEKRLIPGAVPFDQIKPVIDELLST